MKREIFILLLLLCLGINTKAQTEPIAVNYRQDLACEQKGSTVTFELKSNDTYLDNTADLNTYGIKLIVPAGATETPGKWDGDYEGGTKDLQTIEVPGEGTWKLSETRERVYYPVNEFIYSSIAVTFTPAPEFEGFLTPLNYQLISRSTPSVNSNIAQLIVTYDCGQFVVIARTTPSTRST